MLKSVTKCLKNRGLDAVFSLGCQNLGCRESNAKKQWAVTDVSNYGGIGRQCMLSITLSGYDLG